MNTTKWIRRPLGASVLALSILAAGSAALHQQHNGTTYVQVVANRNGHS